MPEVFFEDFEVGEVEEFGSYDVTREEIIEFAEQFDPQPFHTDPEAAKESIYGGLIASGWHTASMTMRMIVDNVVSRTSSMGAIGVDELRWLAPVRPGDTLSARTEVLGKRPSESRPDRGVVRIRTTVLNGDDEAVMSMVSLGLFGKREP